jgi:hypothetical protein
MYKYKNIKIFLNYWLGPILFVWLSWSIYHQIQHQSDLKASWTKAKAVFFGNQAWKCWLAIALMALNWGIEAMKWRELLAPVFKLPFHRAVKATLTGVAFAINTPNRIGEYGGRVLYLPEGERIQALSLTLIGSYSQLLITLLLGSAGLWIFYFGLLETNFEVKLAAYSFWIRPLCILMSTISLVSLFVYLRISWLVRWIEKIPGIAKWGKMLLVIDHLPVRVLLRVLGWSLLRYVVFVIQYLECLVADQCDVPFSGHHSFYCSGRTGHSG